MRKALLLLLVISFLTILTGCKKEIDYTTYYDGFLEKYDYSSITSVTYVGDETQMTVAYDGKNYLNTMTINHVADSENEEDASYKISLICLQNSEKDLYIYTENGSNYYYEIEAGEVTGERVLFSSFLQEDTTVKYSGEQTIDEEVFDILVATTKVTLEDDTDPTDWGTIYEVQFTYDGKLYEAYYLVYLDGTYMLSDGFPTEMDPYYTDTDWVIVGTDGIQNEKTGEFIEFSLTNSYSEMYLYNGYDLIYTVYVHRNTGRIYCIEESYSTTDTVYYTYLDLVTTVTEYEPDETCELLTSTEIYQIIMNVMYYVNTDLGFY